MSFRGMVYLGSPSVNAAFWERFDEYVGRSNESVLYLIEDGDGVDGFCCLGDKLVSISGFFESTFSWDE